MFIARQPIFNKLLNVYGYELLYRANIDSKAFGEADSIKATATVLGGLFEIGLEKIANNGRAFVNFDYDFILSDTIELIDPTSLVIEVLEDVEVDDELLDRLKYLKRKGYRIALDDFIEDYDLFPIVPIADIIKYDLRATPLDYIKTEVEHALSQNKILLAEKVETEEEFIKAEKMGFVLFQGYFFSKPKIVGRINDKKIMISQYVMVIDELKKKNPSYNKLVEIFNTDPNLAYRLVKLSSQRIHKNLIYSIKNALIQMGFRELERWINIIMLQDLSTNKPEELIKISLVRSKFGELIANDGIYRARELEISMMCLFSNIDALTDQSMEDAILGISLTEDIKEALIYRKGVLNPICDLIDCYEKGNWEEVDRISQQIEVDSSILYQMYIDSLEWADDVLRKML